MAIKLGINLFGYVVLVVGILYLIADFTVWNFFGISWWSAALILFGLRELLQ